MKNKKNKIMAFSFAFYNKSMNDQLGANDTGGLTEAHKKILGNDNYELLMTFNKTDINKQREMLYVESHKILAALIDQAILLQSDKNVLSQALPNIDAILYHDQELAQTVVEIGKKDSKRDLVNFLKNILQTEDSMYNSVIYDSSVRILSAIYSNFTLSFEYEKQAENLVNLLIKTCSKEHSIISSYALCVSLAHLLIVPGIPKFFMERQGMNLLKSQFKFYSKDLQVMYYSLLCLWILSFQQEFIKYVEDPKNLIIQDILDTLKKLAREKLTRVGLKILRNLSDSSICVSLMIDNNLIGFLNMEMRKNIKEEQIKENMNYLMTMMEKNYKIFSSYEKFVKELETEKLRFGPCHTAKFWKEHIKSTEKDQFSVIQKLIKLLDSDDDVTQAVACFDLGEFSRLHPFSKQILEDFNGKTKLMKMIENESPQVRENALVAIQKLMINNWQIIS